MVFKKNFLVSFMVTSLMVMTACSENKDEPGSSNGVIKSEFNFQFLKCPNCPIEYVSDNIVFQNEIYFTKNNTFLKYTPATSKWTLLNSAPDDDLFVYNNALYCFTGALLYGEKEIYKYNKYSDTWDNATSDFSLPEDIVITDITSVAGKLYARPLAEYGALVFNPTSRAWEVIASKNFWNEDVAEIGKYGYWLYAGHIYQLDTDTNYDLVKLDTKNFNYYSMTCRYFSSNDILFMGTDELWSGIEMNMGIYSPESNSIKQYTFYNFETASYPVINIPIPFELIANVDGRIFIGPTNTEFYEMKITKK